MLSIPWLPGLILAFLTNTHRTVALHERTYHSSPLAIQPLTILSRSPSYDPCNLNRTLFLVCPVGTAVAQPSPAIYDASGELVWADPRLGPCTDLNLQMVDGRRVLTFWAGNPLAQGSGGGQAVILDDRYEWVRNVSAVGPGGTDAHEFRIVEGKSALLTSYNPVPANLSSIGGPQDGWYVNCIIQEVDIANGRVLFNWTSIDHIPFTEAYNTIGQGGAGTRDDPWDGAHVNSIDKDADGNYLVSARHTWTVYKVDGRDGHVIWRLGGKNSSFSIVGTDHGPIFSWQHDARWRGPKTISVFDDGAALIRGKTASTALVNNTIATGKFVEFDEERMMMHVVKRFAPFPNPGPSLAEGSTERYGPHVVVGYGWTPWLTVHDWRTQEMLYAAVIGPNNASLWKGGITNYRVYQTTLDEFVGRPNTKPAVALEKSSRGEIVVYVSWNGATQVVEYAVLTGSDAKRVHKTVRVQRRTGFETMLACHGCGKYIQVAALGKDGKVLGKSGVYRTSDGRLV
ncbi:hypothetical protein HMN09_00563300 [Mycena chlorophos]|uniref:Arylsulfotransferase n=1 Tax=Mycena chlorophos TaxID=658473 RepID=A0A8H6TAU9_MYCCL|nr:hypothetical protein HMN09_00563300 [Mycena chlorophos]